ncbi:outer membrane lipoprotein carrier protein LolA [Alteromonadaceae bacterium 2753L.S.0a.02]|nr:outer membrane lipoprotein carrier protein LolA [Alteromonadaceae bacterium 2753L.S.0a.02]
MKARTKAPPATGLLLALTLSYQAALAQNPPTIDTLPALKILPVASSHGNFTQQRSLPGLAKPLESSGEFYFDQQIGFLWYTTSPVTQAQFFGPKQSYNYIFSDTATADDTTSKPIKAEKVRTSATRHIAKIIHGIINNDWQQLERIFDAEVVNNDSTQTVTLNPKNSKLQKYLLAITLETSQRLLYYRIEMSSGETVRVDFNNVEENTNNLFESCATSNRSLLQICRHIKTLTQKAP